LQSNIGDIYTAMMTPDATDACTGEAHICLRSKRPGKDEQVSLKETVKIIGAAAYMYNESLLSTF
jgi:hypothetical protein